MLARSFVSAGSFFFGSLSRSVVFVSLVLRSLVSLEPQPSMCPFLVHLGVVLYLPFFLSVVL